MLKMLMNAQGTVLPMRAHSPIQTQRHTSTLRCIHTDVTWLVKEALNFTKKSKKATAKSSEGELGQQRRKGDWQLMDWLMF